MPVGCTPGVRFSCAITIECISLGITRGIDARYAKGTLTDGISNDGIDVCTRTRCYDYESHVYLRSLSPLADFPALNRIHEVSANLDRSLIYRLYPRLIAFDNRVKVESLYRELEQNLKFS